MVEAEGHEQAGEEAVKAANKDNGYGPKEDGGFVPVVAYDRSDLLDLLKQLDSYITSQDC